MRSTLACQSNNKKWRPIFEQRAKVWSINLDLPPMLDHLKRENLGFYASGQDHSRPAQVGPAACRPSCHRRIGGATGGDAQIL